LGKRILIGNKSLQYYKNLLIRADLGLHEQAAKKIQEILKPNCKILDLGAGEGAMSKRLIDMNYEVVSIDVNKEEFNCKEATFYQVDFNSSEALEKLTVKFENQFDLVLGMEVIEHVENPWQYIRLLKKMLKDKGYLLITTPNITSWLSRIIFLFTGKFHQFSDIDLDYGHIAPISEWELRVILKKENFKKIKIYPAGTLPAVWLQKSKKYLFYNFTALIFRLFMKGIKDGWCIMCLAQKKS
jgi:2-polyprenyl-3-methyl-5-hydroxy-6-metoxy-1,4-benzoquinol methylase